MSTVDKERYRELMKSWRDGFWLTGGELEQLATGLIQHGKPAELPNLLSLRVSKAPHDAQRDVIGLFTEVMAAANTQEHGSVVFAAACGSIRRRLVEDQRTIDLFIATYLMLERNKLVLQQRMLMEIWTMFYKKGQVPNRFDLSLLMGCSF